MEKKKPRYNMLQNSAWMLRTAKDCRELQVPLTSAGLAVTYVVESTAAILLPPAVLRVIERSGSVGELLLTILVYSAVLVASAAAHRYLDTIKMYPRITVRTEILGRINRKCAETSYPNLFDEHFDKMRERAEVSVSGNNRATEASWETMTLILQSLLGFIVYLFLMTALPWWMLLLILLLSAASLFPAEKLSMYRYEHQDELGAREKRIYYLFEDSIKREFMKDIRIFGLRSWMTDLTNAGLRAYYAFHKKASARELLAGLADVLLTFLRNGIVYAYLIALVVRGTIGIPEFLLCFSAVEGFSGFIRQIMENLVTLHRQSLDLSLVREFLEFPELFLIEGGLPVPKAKEYEIELRNVSFRYPGAEDLTLRDVSLTLHPGEKLAVVGLNGAGKTTLVKLMSGLLDPTEGAVLLNGTDIREYNRKEYYSLFSAVFQSFNLLAVSVKQNVAQHFTDIDEERFQKAVSDAGLAEKIETLPKGADTRLNRETYEDAVEFSGGEMQRLMLARALYKDAPFVFLDEPTAALDPLAEEDIYRKYNAFTAGKSSVFISHRLASTRFCDRILLISGGVIREEGTHDLLLSLGGEYAALFEEQARYYREHPEEGGAENE